MIFKDILPRFLGFDPIEKEIDRIFQSESLEKLRAITGQMKPLKDYANGDSVDGVNTYTTTAGEMSVRGLYWESIGSIVTVHCPKGYILEDHTHEQNEVAGVFSGAIVFLIGGKEFIVSPGDSICIPKNEVHSAFYPMETISWAVLSPGSEDFPKPKGGNNASR